MTENIFQDVDVIYSYTVRDGVNDGYWHPANEGRLGELSRQAFKYPCFYSPGVSELISKAIDNPESGADLPGVWGDIMAMSKLSPDREEINESTISSLPRLSKCRSVM